MKTSNFTVDGTVFTVEYLYYLDGTVEIESIEGLPVSRFESILIRDLITVISETESGNRYKEVKRNTEYDYE